MACQRGPRLLSSAIETSICHHEILTMLLEVVLAGSHELDSSELVAVILLVIAATTNPSTYPRASNLEMMGPIRPR